MPRTTRLRFDYKTQAQSLPTRRWLLLALFFPFVCAVLAYSIVMRAPATPTAPAAEPTATIATPTLVPAAAPIIDKLDFIVRPNDTLEVIFRRLKLRLEDLTSILSLPGARQAFSQIRPGDQLTVAHEDGAIRAISRRISETEVLSVTRADDGFAAEVIATPIEIRHAYADGSIDSSLFVAARAAGVKPETILQLANDIFGWTIDFALDIRPGDRFRLVYEQKYRNDRHIGDGRILAAEFVNDGDTHRAVYYASPDGRLNGYYTLDGRSLHQRFLRAPLDFTRVSSNFNPARRHPILNTIRAHQGVDYAAPSGTVIKAAGEGRVNFAGVRGGYGKVIVLEHGGGVSTLYAHLSRFARGLRLGKRVQQGETIGYVGRTGAATGPHLHYEYRVHGVHKNPRTVRLPEATPIARQYLADFTTKAQRMVAELGQARATVVAQPAEQTLDQPPH